MNICAGAVNNASWNVYEVCLQQMIINGGRDSEGRLWLYIPREISKKMDIPPYFSLEIDVDNFKFTPRNKK